MNDQTQVSDDFEYSIWIPVETPKGQVVTIQAGERNGRRIMHAETPDQNEFYVEVIAYAAHHPHESLAAEQRKYLAENSADGSTTEPMPREVEQLSGLSFDFQGTLQGRWKVRNFLFVDGPNRTYRIVHDPTSDLNHKALQSLQLRNTVRHGGICDL